MKNICLAVIFLILAASFVSAEPIAIKTKDGNIVHWSDYWQDKDTGNYCTEVSAGDFCIVKEDIERVYKGKEAAKIEKRTKEWTNKVSGSALDVIAGKPEAEPAPAESANSTSVKTESTDMQRESANLIKIMPKYKAP